MPTARREAVVRHVRTLFEGGPLGGLADGPLLERFLDRRDGSAESAFEVLVRRHGPAVWQVCRGLLGDRHEAEDAFQGTFLVLARRAGSIRRRESVGSWLHGVALRVAGQARSADVEIRAAVVVGLLDHGAIRVNYAKALGVGLDRARPNYLRVELERQERTPGGDWSAWEPVVRKANRLVLDNITEMEAELAPPEVRLDPLVDVVPFFRKGSWRGIHLTKLVPEGARTEQGLISDRRDPALTEAPELFIRQIDFTAEPGRIYRYRARVVAADPNVPPTDWPRERAGPWSEPTTAVSVPSDPEGGDDPSPPTGSARSPSPARKRPAPGSRPRG